MIFRHSRCETGEKRTGRFDKTNGTGYCIIIAVFVVFVNSEAMVFQQKESFLLDVPNGFCVDPIF